MKIYAGDRNFMKTPKKKTPIKDFLKKGTVKGIKFAGKVAVNPLTLAFGAGSLIAKTAERKPFKFPKNRRFDKYGRQS
jgi:hypothetical protein|tara:strand:+ start:131 stop:364 length:234 start_codon:yes stop_codon:yes gene_type:complete